MFLNAVGIALRKLLVGCQAVTLTSYLMEEDEWVETTWHILCLMRCVDESTSKREEHSS
ncbi:MAG: hypothetical protein RMH77_00045 [Sulfolobales archaeon]|nr:hypothetical protein [Sulfolobales archaeon]MCX8186768.1 hypothetical protein [Sulfolobales archaeon]MDW7968793.1 hypothetical protein [Sulfolobales archaeon]